MSTTNMADPQDKIWYLKQVNLFMGIPDKEIMQIAKKMSEKKCNKKEILYTPFEVTKSIYVLKKGEVTLYHLHNGKKLIIDTLNEGSIFGNLSFKNEKSSHFAEVTASSYLCVFEVNDFIKIIQSKPDLMLKLLQTMSNRINDFEVRFKGNIYDAKEKILNQLHLLHKNENASIFNKLMRKKSKITHEKLSHYTGLTRETVTRIIQELKREGKLYDRPDGGFTLINRQ